MASVGGVGRRLGPALGSRLVPAPYLLRRGFRTSQICLKLRTGIVGLPNVGKSTLFNALTETQGAEASNYPYCTIEPNVGVVEVPDPRLAVLADLSKSKKVVPTTLEIVDIAGLIKGASKGEGLGNQFLANIRECDAVIHVVRCFEDPNVVHVDGSVDPVRDAEVINLELALSDLAQVEKRLERIKKDRKADPAEAEVLQRVYDAVEAGASARTVADQLTAEERVWMDRLQLLTAKRMIYAANVADADLAEGNDMVRALEAQADKEGASVVVVSAQVESELIELPVDERAEFLESLGVTIDDCGLRALVRAAYALLGLRTYFTSGETETRAWTIREGWTAPQAAGVIHGDFERGFIKAETVSYDDLVRLGSERAAKEEGLVRSEGKEYVVQEADVMLFRFNV